MLNWITEDFEISGARPKLVINNGESITAFSSRNCIMSV
jgi:hypothetical protein